MAISKETTLASVELNALLDSLSVRLNGGSVELQSAADAVLGSGPLNADFAPAADAGVLTASAIADVAMTVQGTITKYRLKDSGGVVRVSGNASKTGDATTKAMQISNNVVEVGDKIEINSLTITLPATVIVTE